MNCAELRQRIVDPASASVGGHATVVQHLHECAACRAAARSFAEIEKIFFSLDAGAPPEDFDELLRRRLRQPASSLRAFAGNRLVVGSAAAVLVLSLLAVVLWLRPAIRTAGVAPSPATRAPRRAAERAEPPEILAVRSTPLALGFTPVPAEERTLALSLESREFLAFLPALETLGPFFPENLPPAPPRRPGSPEEEALRITEWQDAPAAERARWQAADAEFRGRSAPDRDRLRARWQALGGFSPDEKAGLRRLAGRIEELDAKRRGRLSADLVALSRAPPAERRLRWRALPFARTLTGQEAGSGEKLLLLF